MELKTRINDRRMKVGITAENLSKLMNIDRVQFYNKITCDLNVWSLQEICTILNALECSYEELFRGNPFEDTNIYAYGVRTYPLSKHIRTLANGKGIGIPHILKAMGLKSRQAFYHNAKSKRFKIYQINAILELLNLNFDQVFAVKVFRFNKEVRKRKEESFTFKEREFYESYKGD